MLIHIGYQKTASTWLQRAFFSQLTDTFACPWAVLSPIVVHHFLFPNPFRFDPDAIREHYREGLQQAERDGLCPVISFEDLVGCGLSTLRNYGKEVADRLHAVFPNAKILIVFREQQSIGLSLYKQYVRDGGLFDIDAYWGTGTEQTGFLPIMQLHDLEYDLLVGYYRDLFGPQNVLALAHEHFREQPAAFQEVIFDFVGTDRPPIDASEPVNPAWGALTLRIMRALNKAAPADPLGRWSRARRASLRFCRLLNACLPRLLQRREEARLRSFLRRRFKGHFRESNRRLAEMTGTDLARFGYDT